MKRPASLTVSGRYLASIGTWSGRVGSKDRTGREKMTTDKRAVRKARITLPKVLK